MNTSYFAKHKNKPNGVCIALKHPPGFPGECYPDLYPCWPFLSKYFEDGDWLAYTEAYQLQVLNKLDPQKVLSDLRGKVLLCWEGPEKNCHRHLVAEWIFEHTGYKVEELA